MKVTKKVLSHLEKNYALAPIHYQGQDCFLVASELADKCLLFDRDGNLLDTVWEKPGGVMSMVYVPGTDGQFLATLKFYGFNNAGNANLSIITPRGKGDWEIRTLAELPFVHRIDILERGGARYLIACALKSGHEYDDDWRFPGKIFVAQLPEDLSGFDADHPLELTVLMEGLQKNHGYYMVEQNGVPTCIICAENGILQVTPPESPGADWEIETLSTDPSSDAVLVDFDGDGELELGVIAPFHGEKVRFYKKRDGAYRLVYEHPEDLPFCHAFFGGTLCGKPTLIVGHRAGARDLLAFTYDPQQNTYRVETLDRGRGPANVLHFVHHGKDVLIATNRETDEVARYELEAD
jgi:hypothetical protein